MATSQPTFWEPWQPQAGDRVRVVLMGECVEQGSWNSAASSANLTHTDIPIHGKTGYVKSVAPWVSNGHRFSIKFDQQFTFAGTTWNYCSCAAIELVKL